MKQLRWKDFSLVSKIVIEVGMIAVLLFAMNMLFYVRINNSMQKMDNVYASNAELTELSQVFEKVQDNMYKYLKVKSSQTLLDYYQNEAKYRNELEKLNEDNINDPVKLLERNIRKMSETYLDCTAETVSAKRGRNVEQYKRKYDDATKLYRYIQSSIDELNNLMFQENSSTYALLRAVMRYLEISNSVIMIIIVAGGMLLLIQATRNMFVPLSNMAETAQLVGQGNFHVKMHDTDAQDELGTVTRAFNTMVENLDLYMARTKASMEKEQQMMERELLMENHLKEAQLKYLQSQINPHFLFNALESIRMHSLLKRENETADMVEKLAIMQRQYVEWGNDAVTVAKECEFVKAYLALQKYRFGERLNYNIDIEADCMECQVPKLTLVTFVENACVHGIESKAAPGWIFVRIFKKAGFMHIEVEDTGSGIDPDALEKMKSNMKNADIDMLKTGGRVGVINACLRIKMVTESKAVFDVDSEEGCGTTVMIKIPETYL